jgi:glycosyltransferase involved in cell wall biosynthesis
VFTPFKETRRRLFEHGVPAIRYADRGVRLVDYWSATAMGEAVLGRLRHYGWRRAGRYLDGVLRDHRIDIALFNEVASGCRRIGDHPFIVTIWDLDHRDHPEFPEAYHDRVFESRERQLGMILPRATGVVANSRSGAVRIADLYHVDPARIIELPFLPSLAARRHAAGGGSATADEVRRKYALPDRYVFYPVYFLAQKNHLYILEAVAELNRRGIELHAVFCGDAEPENLAHVKRQVHALDIADRVRFLGWLPDGEIPALYEAAVALVMPTYCGPANLPPLEAVTLGCPVIYSDLPGCREQMGDAALYCDLADVSTLVEQLRSLLADEALVRRLREAGHRLAGEIARIDYGKRLAAFLDHYAALRRPWTWPSEA